MRVRVRVRAKDNDKQKIATTRRNRRRWKVEGLFFGRKEGARVVCGGKATLMPLEELFTASVYYIYILYKNRNRRVREPDWRATLAG